MRDDVDELRGRQVACKINKQAIEHNASTTLDGALLFALLLSLHRLQASSIEF